MKKISLILTVLTMILGLTSCQDPDKYMEFVGKWGLARLDYYNIDYSGKPIEASRITYYFTPGDTIDGIDLIFKMDQTGTMVDRSRDTLFIPIGEGEYDTIVCPDTVLYTSFTFSYDNLRSTLYMNMPNAITYRMQIKQKDDQSFTYINQYDEYIVEEALMKRLLNTKGTKGNRTKVSLPHRPGSLFSR